MQAEETNPELVRSRRDLCSISFHLHQVESPCAAPAAAILPAGTPAPCSTAPCQHPRAGSTAESSSALPPEPTIPWRKRHLARGLFLGLKWIQLRAQPRTGAPDAAAGKTAESTRAQTKAFHEEPCFNCLCSHPGIHGHRCLVTGGVMLSPKGRVFSAGWWFLSLNSCPKEEPGCGVWYSSTKQGC